MCPLCDTVCSFFTARILSLFQWYSGINDDRVIKRTVIKVISVTTKLDNSAILLLSDLCLYCDLTEYFFSEDSSSSSSLFLFPSSQGANWFPPPAFSWQPHPFFPSIAAVFCWLTTDSRSRFVVCVWSEVCSLLVLVLGLFLMFFKKFCTFLLCGQRTQTKHRRCS